jgi:hypothetical protein
MEYSAEFYPNMDAITLQNIWVMCDAVEDSAIGTKLQRPILRAIPNNQYNQNHSLHVFGIPQFKRVLSSNGVQQIRIRMCEDLLGSTLAIYCDVFLKLEVESNDAIRV